MRNKKTKRGKRNINLWVDRIIDYRKIIILLTLNLLIILIIAGSIQLGSFAGRNFVAASVNEPCDGLCASPCVSYNRCNTQETCCNAAVTTCTSTATTSYHCVGQAADTGGFNYDNKQAACEAAWCLGSSTQSGACDYAYTDQGYTWYATVTGGSASCCGDDGAGDSFYYINTGANPDTCQRCNAGVNNAAVSCYQNQVCAADGHLLTQNTDTACDGTLASCTCYYGESCAAAAYTAPSTATFPPSGTCSSGTFNGDTNANCLVASTNTCYYSATDPCTNSGIGYSTDSACYGSGDIISSTCYNGTESCIASGCTDGVTDCGTQGAICTSLSPYECINATTCTTGATGWVGPDTAIYGSTITSASCESSSLTGTNDYCYIDSSNACYYQSGDSCDPTKGWGSSTASDFNYVECPDYCYDDNNGGTCAQTTRANPTSAQTCYYTDTCSSSGCSLTSSGTIRADYCDTCAAAPTGVTQGTYCPATNASCSSSCSDTGTILYEASIDRTNDCSGTTCQLTTDTLTYGKIWTGTAAATCDNTECNLDCSTTLAKSSGTCMSSNCICNSNPLVLDIPITSAVTLSEGIPTLVKFSFVVDDQETISTLINESMQANFSKTGEDTRWNTTGCVAVVEGTNATSQNYTCTIEMQYWDGSGTWTVDVQTGDNTTNVSSQKTFTVNTLTAINITANTLSWPNLNVGNIDQLMSTDEVNVTNIGNQNLTSITLRAINLIGETTPTVWIPAANFTATWGERACNIGTALVNNSATTITGSRLDFGPGSLVTTNNATHICLEEVGQDITQQAYSTAGDVEDWIITGVVA
jgi:hypothetical protein